MEAIYAIGFGCAVGSIAGLLAFVWKSRPPQPEKPEELDRAEWDRRRAEEREVSLAAARADRAELDRIVAAAKLDAPDWVIGGVCGDRKLFAGWESEDGKRTASILVMDLEAELVLSTEPVSRESVERITICGAILPALAGMIRDHVKPREAIG